MSVDANKAVIQRLMAEVYNQANLSVADEIFAANAVHHDAGDWAPDMYGPDAIKQAVTAWHAAFPDFHVNLDALLGEGDQVAYRWTVTGTQHGEFQGIPASGKAITVTGQVLMRFEGAKIVEGWTNMDDLGLRHQLGAAAPA